MTPPSFVAAAAILALCAIAAVTDMRTGRIPNRLVAWGLGLGVVVPVTAALFSAPEGALLSSVGMGLGRALAGLLVTAAIPLTLFLMRALGGGDVKLFAALGALGGPSLGFEIVSHAFFFAVPLALAIWIKQGRLWTALATTARLALTWAPRWMRVTEDRCRSASTGLPRRVRHAELTAVKFAPAILAAAVWVLM